MVEETRFICVKIYGIDYVLKHNDNIIICIKNQIRKLKLSDLNVYVSIICENEIVSHKISIVFGNNTVLSYFYTIDIILPYLHQRHSVIHENRHTLFCPLS